MLDRLNRRSGRNEARLAAGHRLGEQSLHPRRRHLRHRGEHLGLPAHRVVHLRQPLSIRMGGRIHGLSNVFRLEVHAQRLGTAGLDAVGHGGLDEQRPHRQHPDSVTAPLEFERLGQRSQRELGGRVGGQLGLAVDRRSRAHVDHLGPRGVAQVGERGVQAGHCAVEIDVDHLLVRFERDVLEGAGGEHARVVDQDVEAA